MIHHQIRFLLIACIVILPLLMWGCSSSEQVLQLTAEERYEKGKKLFAEEDYLEAIEEFRIVTLQFSGTALADDALFMMAQSRFNREEYVLAAYEYELLIKTMPTSEYVPRSRYKLAECYYRLSPKSHLDQEYTKRAIEDFQTYVEYYPTDTLVTDAEQKISELISKLSKKEYENGIIYMKMEYYKAAIVSFDYILEHYHDTPYAEPALFKKAEALYYRRRYNESKEDLQRFLRRYEKSELRGQAESLLREINSLTQGLSEPGSS